MDQADRRFPHQVPGLAGERADGHLQPGLVRDDVVRGARVEAAHGDHHRVEDVEPAGHQHLQRRDDLAGHRNGVGGVVRLGAVAAAAGDGDVQRLGRGHHRPLPAAEHPGGQFGRRDVQRVRGVGPFPGRVEHALLDHEPGAAVPLLAGLEHEHHAARQVRPARRQQPGRPDEHGRVQVMPAGVHGAADTGREVQPGPLGDRQRVHVGPQQHHRPPIPPLGPAAQHGGDRRQRRADGDLQRQAVQRGEDLLLGQWKLQPDLWLGWRAADARVRHRSPPRPGLLLPCRAPFGVSWLPRPECHSRRRAPAEGGAARKAGSGQPRAA